MSRLLSDLRDVWAEMLVPPWRQAPWQRYQLDTDGISQSGRWRYWLSGWVWALGGIGLGALVAPTLVQTLGLTNTAYQDWLVIAVAAVAGLLVQVLGLGLYVLHVPLWNHVILVPLKAWHVSPKQVSRFADVTEMVFLLLPVVALGYGIYRYVAWIGVAQGLFATGFVGGLIVTKIALPLIFGAASNRFMNWLRSGKDVKTAD